MFYTKYRDYLDSNPGPLLVVDGTGACDLCEPEEKMVWDLSRPWLCEDHARELGLLW